MALTKLEASLRPMASIPPSASGSTIVLLAPIVKEYIPQSLHQWIHIQDIIEGPQVNGLPMIQNITKHSGNSGRVMYMVTMIVLGERERGGGLLVGKSALEWELEYEDSRSSQSTNHDSHQHVQGSICKNTLYHNLYLTKYAPVANSCLGSNQYACEAGCCLDPNQARCVCTCLPVVGQVSFGLDISTCICPLP